MNPRLHIFFSLGTAPSTAKYKASEGITAELQRWFPSRKSIENEEFNSTIAALLTHLGEPDPALTGRIVFHPHWTKEVRDGVVLKGNAQQCRPDVRVDPMKTFLDQSPAYVRQALGEEFTEKKGRFADASDYALLGSQQEPGELLRKVTALALREVLPDDLLFLETTGGIRSIQMAFVMASVLVPTLRPGARIAAMTYGEFTAPGPEKPIFDLRALHGVARQAPAVAALVQRLDAGPLAAWFDERGDTHKALDAISGCVDLNQPTTLGARLAGLAENLEKGSGGDSHLVALLKDELGTLAPRGGAGDASAQVTWWAEKLIPRLRDAGRLGAATVLLREAAVSAAVIKLGGAAVSTVADLTDKTRRANAERALFLSGEPIGPLWRALTDFRNSVGHAGTGRSVDDLQTLLREIGATIPPGEDSVLVYQRFWERDPLRLIKAIQGSLKTPGETPPVHYVSDKDTAMSPEKSKRLTVDTSAPAGKNWGDNQWKKVVKEGLPASVYLDLDPIRTHQILTAASLTGVPCYVRWQNDWVLVPS